MALMNPTVQWLGLATLIGSMLLLPGEAQAKARTDREKHELIGSVRTVVTYFPELVTTETYDPAGSLKEIALRAVAENGTGKIVFTYDAQGQVQEERAYEVDGSLVSRKFYRYSYDHKGRERAIIAATDRGAFVHALFSEYDDRGHLVEELNISGDGTVDKSLFDVRGDVVYMARYHNGRIMLETVHVYDPHRRLQERRAYGVEGSLIRHDHFRYTEDGLRIEETSEFYHKDHMRRLLTTSELDSTGNWVKQMITRWIVKDGEATPTDRVVHRERTITYYP